MSTGIERRECVNSVEMSDHARRLVLYCCSSNGDRSHVCGHFLCWLKVAVVQSVLLGTCLLCCVHPNVSPALLQLLVGQRWLMCGGLSPLWHVYGDSGTECVWRACPHQVLRLFIVVGVEETAAFAPLTRKEISVRVVCRLWCLRWFQVASLGCMYGV